MPADSVDGLQDHISTLEQLLHSTAMYSQNNAALLVGHRGVCMIVAAMASCITPTCIVSLHLQAGKTLVLRHVLKRLKQQLTPLGRSFVEIYLHGAQQTDDTLAIR